MSSWKIFFTKKGQIHILRVCVITDLQIIYHTTCKYRGGIMISKYLAQTIWRKEVDPPRKKNTEKDRSETTSLQMESPNIWRRPSGEKKWIHPEKKTQRKTEAKQHPSRWRALRRKIPVRSQQQDKEAEKTHVESSSSEDSSGNLAVARMRACPASGWKKLSMSASRMTW
jgi:hypothetical protein